MEMTCLNCGGEIQELSDEEIEDEFSELIGMPVYKCRECGVVAGADVFAEAQSIAESRQRRMERRERRAEGW